MLILSMQLASNGSGERLHINCYSRRFSLVTTKKGKKERGCNEERESEEERDIITYLVSLGKRERMSISEAPSILTPYISNDSKLLHSAKLLLINFRICYPLNFFCFSYVSFVWSTFREKHDTTTQNLSAVIDVQSAQVAPKSGHMANPSITDRSRPNIEKFQIWGSAQSLMSAIRKGNRRESEAKWREREEGRNHTPIRTLLSTSLLLAKFILRKEKSGALQSDNP